jgi:hypothetical protein
VTTTPAADLAVRLLRALDWVARLTTERDQALAAVREARLAAPPRVAVSGSRVQALGWSGGFGVSDVTWPVGAKPEFLVIGHGRRRGEAIAVCSDEAVAELIASLLAAEDSKS